ncbi:sulfite exporter TauE/SafE family protein [Effusibacillus pohliae]|uniref:sulfite exporter TauE/SafE family protein n=1 Tax=Effusibacillus pohliae TaxID=232270 RepID=UPI00035DECFC|nr:sulfite exporter TauE/SafE family protein [Effusibacillus pohliae]
MGIEMPIAGFIVGLVVGMTGMGGALIMTPIMIFVFGVSPALAIGTDLIYSSVTKIFGAWQHWRQKTIDFAVVKWLSAGSIPGALLGVLMILLMQNHFDTKQLNSAIGKILGVTYLLIAAVMVWRIFGGKGRTTRPDDVQRPPKGKLVALGAIGGFVVGMTSVGSGTLFMAVLAMIYPVASAKLVGTDILQAVLVTAAAGLAHMSIGNVDLHLVGKLLIGSIPGILIGSRLTTKIPDMAVRTALMLMLFLSGMKLLS